jgi:hypothetical protein
MYQQKECTRIRCSACFNGLHAGDFRPQPDHYPLRQKCAESRAIFTTVRAFQAGATAVDFAADIGVLAMCWTMRPEFAACN